MSKILTANGYKRFRAKIEKFPEPLKSYFISRHRVDDYDSFRLDKPWNPLVPQFVLTDRNEEFLFLFYNCGGQDRYRDILKILEEISIVFEEGLKLPAQLVKTYSSVFFFDADDEGIEKTFEEFKKRYTGHFGELEALKLNDWISVNNHHVGCFIFSNDKGKGTLEDILVPMIEEKHKNIAEAAESFFVSHAVETDKITNSEAKKKKAIITTTGQFNHPGYSMAVILKESDLLDEEVLKNNALSKQIFDFFSKIESENE
ncbi:MAG: hypothetical protein GY749_21205 [Desulfobacteraceae bacterium]|nr:hypothetical protein [Desulfobacteraceae bacterium]